MKIITSLVDTPLPMPDGRVLPARGKLRVPDHIAAGERVRSWGLNVVVEEYAPPAAEETKAEPQPEAPKGSKARLSDRQATGDEKA